MDALSPVRTCGSWAVYSAKSLEKPSGGAEMLTPVQSDILSILKETEGMEPTVWLERFGRGMTFKNPEREFAALRHMEKVRGAKRSDRVVWLLW